MSPAYTANLRSELREAEAALGIARQNLRDSDEVISDDPFDSSEEGIATKTYDRAFRRYQQIKAQYRRARLQQAGVMDMVAARHRVARWVEII